MQDNNLVIKLMEQGFNSMEHRFIEIDKRFDSLEKTADARIVQLGEAHQLQLNRCNALHGGLDTRVDGLSEKMANYNGYCKEKKRRGEIDYYFWGKIVGIFTAALVIIEVGHLLVVHVLGK